MNYQRAVIAAGASIAGFLIMGVTLYLCVIATLDFSFPGSGLQAGEAVLIYLLLSTAVGIGSSLLTGSLSGGWRRIMASAAVAFILALVLVYIMRTSDASQADERAIVPALLLISALSVLIATARSEDISRSRTRIITAFVVMFAGVGCAGAVVAWVADIEVRVLLAAVAWIFPPTLAALIVFPSSGRAQAPED